MSRDRRILIATDFSRASEGGAREGARLARALGCGVVIVHAVEDRVHPLVDEKTRRQVMATHRGLAEEAAARWCSEVFAGCEVATCIGEGAPADVIQDCAERWQADLVVIGSRGHGAIEGLLLGSTADRVVRHATRPVLVVPAGEGAEGG
jgi:nucleotide-binding universal stress UspA family protein